MKLRLAGTIAAAVVAASGAAAQTVETDLVYGDRERNRLDLYMPAGTERPPIVLFIHGGRWFRNGKDQVHLFDRVQQMNDAGLAVASMNYTYSSEATWPAQKEDVLAALRFVAEHGETYGYDASRVAVWGQSSGAHLTLWAGLLSAEGAAPQVDAIVSWYAPSSLYDLASDRVADDVPGENGRFPEPTPESRLLGVPVPENRDAADAASPEPYVRQLSPGISLPPILLMHGDADFVVSPLQSLRMRETLLDHDPTANVSLVLVEGGEHGGDAFGPHVPEVIGFLAAHLAVRT